MQGVTGVQGITGITGPQGIQGVTGRTDVRLKDCGNQKELIWYSAYGDEVTTTKTQTLSNKTLTSPAVNGVVSGGISSSSGMILSDLMQTARETIELIDYTP